MMQKSHLATHPNVFKHFFSFYHIISNHSIISMFYRLFVLQNLKIILNDLDIQHHSAQHLRKHHFYLLCTLPGLTVVVSSRCLSGICFVCKASCTVQNGSTVLSYKQQLRKFNYHKQISLSLYLSPHLNSVNINSH